MPNYNRDDIPVDMANNNSVDQQGVWVGIDLGTSNSAVAIFDSFRGGSKWYVRGLCLPSYHCLLFVFFAVHIHLHHTNILFTTSRVRLPEVAEKTSNKAGRIMPSVVRFIDDSNDCKDENPLVGYPALIGSPKNVNGKVKISRNSNSSLLRSVKRLLGKRYEDLAPLL